MTVLTKRPVCTNLCLVMHKDIILRLVEWTGGNFERKKVGTEYDKEGNHIFCFYEPKIFRSLPYLNTLITYNDLRK